MYYSSVFSFPVACVFCFLFVCVFFLLFFLVLPDCFLFVCVLCVCVRMRLFPIKREHLGLQAFLLLWGFVYFPVCISTLLEGVSTRFVGFRIMLSCMRQSCDAKTGLLAGCPLAQPCREQTEVNRRPTCSTFLCMHRHKLFCSIQLYTKKETPWKKLK